MTMENDISLLKLAEPASGFEPVCLPEAGVTFEGKFTASIHLINE